VPNACKRELGSLADKMTQKERDENIATAKAKYFENPWWDSEDPKEVFWGQVNESCLLMDFDKFHEATEKALGRPVWTHEFANPKSLIEEFQGKIPKATMSDVLGKLPQNKKIIIIQK
jgi:hypothetical protein